LVDDCDDEEFILQEEKYVNWSGSETSTPLRKSHPQLSRDNTTISYKVRHSVMVANGSVVGSKGYKRLRVLAAAAAFAAAKRRLATLLLED
jgi:hypothetical protein